ncbi:hypothetical protein OPV22_006637 [Ensete ventricosum]|uniref:Remorin C-terminal domain-containing protein n=1 Tax=Ensete ventricosum TaxID=4639 RepID=A0AAV8Q680_ENSVE|nr:hypothetical protein OPV22_006637 [Ensete ventricosum]
MSATEDDDDDYEADAENKGRATATYLMPFHAARPNLYLPVAAAAVAVALVMKKKWKGKGQKTRWWVVGGGEQPAIADSVLVVGEDDMAGKEKKAEGIDEGEIKKKKKRWQAEDDGGEYDSGEDDKPILGVFHPSLGAVSSVSKGEEYQEERQNTTEGRILLPPPPKTASSKEERKHTRVGFQRQFSGQMSDVNNASDTAFATAVAAAAYAITSLEEEEDPLNQRRLPAKIKSKREDNMNKPIDSILSRWLTGKEPKDDEKQSVKKLDESGFDRKLSGKAKETNLTTKRTPTISDKYPNDTGSSRSEHIQNQTGRQASSTIKPTASPSGKGNGVVKTTGYNTVETTPDAWEKETKMDEIKKRYERMMNEIREWETQKKLKAKHRLERKERFVERRKEKALQEYHYKIERIDRVSGEARALAEEKRKNDESKTQEKARMMRSKGNGPHTCLCF